MLAKVITPRRRPPRAETGFAKRVAYACHKATAIALGNLAGGWTDAAFQMQAVARMNKRLQRRCYHMVLSWGDGENPTDEAALAAAKGVLREMGWQGHQHVLAVHRDRRNVHVHVVLNRVNPLTGKACSISHDYARLERACRVIERAFGWPPDRGRFLPRLVNGELVLVPRPKAYWDARRVARAEGLRPDPRGVRGAERRTGVAPLRDRLPARVISQARKVIEQAAGWAALHAGLLDIGLRYLRHGPGARIAEVAGRGWMPASHLGSAFGLRRLCARLGRFQPGPPPAPAAPGAQSPAAARARQRHAAQRAERRDRYAELRQRQKKRAVDLGALLRGLDRTVAAAFRLVLAEDQRAARAKLCATPLPRLGDYGISPPDVEALARREEQRRRHRHLLREERVRKAGGRIMTAALDHTRARQLWQRASWRAAVAEIDADTVPSVLRIGPERLLFPRLDPGGAMLGYDLLIESEGRLVARPISGQNLALAMLGPHDATRCAVTSDVATAAMLSAEYPELLIIAAAPSLSRRTAQQLTSVVGRRPLDVVCRSADDAGFAAQVTARVPHAMRLQPAEPAPSAQIDEHVDAEGRTAPHLPGPPATSCNGDAEEPPEPCLDDVEPDLSPWLST
ncbi:relaxase/mobilization nuclease domain-containing protein [Paracoccus sp. Z118]|uniref:relaxase/mobilization nuclease domain-containing protein n=1 Tax=Paracoccus sp. Z118 TaxID=2851017 RepID=UPI001C2CB4FE|nr:relaxase/mobilization nuclease domain-containing protein [Paracoccus sp. Z118]MBV0892965.1 relaxase/mobilization nuclease domain-containing protein [Paracoccus sp. Z118]